MSDVGRGRFNYHTSWIWGSLMIALPETGEIFALNIIIGFGKLNHKPEESFSEDFIMLNGKHYKLDQTVLLEYSPEMPHNSMHYFRTIDAKDRVFTKRGCDLRFEPFTVGSQPREGRHYTFLSFIQDLLYGLYSGHCWLESESGEIREIKLESVLGTVEHVKARW
jgi:hypothetical protein